jgi:hypothetical protein
LAPSALRHSPAGILSKVVPSKAGWGFVTAMGILAASVACGGAGAGTTHTPEGGALPAITITFNPGAANEAVLAVEIADTPEERQRGLSFRESLAADAGMLFDYGQETGAAFWMKDTAIPLSIAFIAADGRIVDIQDMEPLSEEMHRSPEPYQWAVEANRGWFAAHGVSMGDEVRLPGQ